MSRQFGNKGTEFKPFLLRGEAESRICFFNKVAKFCAVLLIQFCLDHILLKTFWMCLMARKNNPVSIQQYQSEYVSWDLPTGERGTEMLSFS